MSDYIRVPISHKESAIVRLQNIAFVTPRPKHEGPGCHISITCACSQSMRPAKLAVIRTTMSLEEVANLMGAPAAPLTGNWRQR